MRTCIHCAYKSKANEQINTNLNLKKRIKEKTKTKKRKKSQFKWNKKKRHTENGVADDFGIGEFFETLHPSVNAVSYFAYG